MKHIYNMLELLAALQISQYHYNCLEDQLYNHDGS